MVTFLAFSLLLQGSTGGGLDQVVDARYRLAEGTGFSGSVLVEHNGRVLLSKGYGLADRASGRKVTPATLFSIGSVTKWFTALAALRLEEEGKLRLSEPLGRLMDHVPADKAKITIEQLLSHTAGFGEYIDRPGEGGDFAKIDRAEALRRILGQKLLFEPGTKSQYSNVGYTLLAIVLERVAGQSWEQCVRKLVFEPAEMANSGFFGEHRWPQEMFAVGQGAKTHGVRNMAYYWGSVTWSLKGAGGIVSTPEDLGKALHALSEGRLLGPENRSRMLRPAFGQEGFGWMVGQSSAGTPFCNVGGGDDFGFHASILYLPQEGDLVIACSNSNTPDRLRAANIDVLRALRAK